MSSTEPSTPGFNKSLLNECGWEVGGVKNGRIWERRVSERHRRSSGLQPDPSASHFAGNHHKLSNSFQKEGLGLAVTRRESSPLGPSSIWSWSGPQPYPSITTIIAVILAVLLNFIKGYPVPCLNVLNVSYLIYTAPKEFCSIILPPALQMWKLRLTEVVSCLRPHSCCRRKLPRLSLSLILEQV